MRVGNSFFVIVVSSLLKGTTGGLKSNVTYSMKKSRFFKNSWVCDGSTQKLTSYETALL